MATKARPTTIKKVVAENRKARFNYEIIDTRHRGEWVAFAARR